VALRTACRHGSNGWCIVEAGAVVVDRILARWWVLLGTLPLACAGAEIEATGSFTGGVQTASDSASASASASATGDDDDGSGADDGSGDATHDGGSDDDADGSVTQGTDGGSDEAEAEGPEGGTDDGNCVPGEEVCDGVDNDCDDDVDEADPQLGNACETGMSGACAAGTNECQGGAIVCAPTSVGSAETCNGADDDCDGAIDQGNPGGGGACDTGLAGVCGPGTNACQGGGIVCAQNTQSTAETCDGEDDDCNGSTDEGNPGGGGGCNTGLAGVCAAGTTTCQNASLVCVQNVGASQEVCGDGQDNNCDGAIDNGCGCTHAECVAGEALVNGCSGCVSSVCAADPFCCANSWDSICVGEASSICGFVCQGSCSHSPCVQGGVLVSGCDGGGCVASICASDPFCCNNSWDGLCVGEVASICGLTC